MVVPPEEPDSVTLNDALTPVREPAAAGASPTTWTRRPSNASSLYSPDHGFDKGQAPDVVMNAEQFAEQMEHEKDDIAGSMSIMREAIFVFVCVNAQLTTQIALTMSLFPLHKISESWGLTNPGVQSWLIAGYSLTSGTFILIFGRWGDLFGYRSMILFGYAWFALWSLIAGVAVYSNYVLFVFARVLAGFGPAMLLPNGVAILGATYGAPKYVKKMRFFFSLFGAVAPFGGWAGGFFGSLLAQFATWPWAFYIMTIYLCILTVLSFLVIPTVHHPSQTMTWKHIVGHLDLTGSFLGVAGLVLVNFGFNQAPVVGWQEAYVYVLLIIGIVFLVGFAVWEMRYEAHPLIPFHALNIDTGFVLGCITLGWSAFGIWIFYLCQFLQQMREQSMVISSLEFLPAPASGLCAAILTPLALKYFGPHRVMLISMSAFSLGTLLLSVAGTHQSYWGLTFCSILIQPIGMDTSFPAATIILSQSVSREHQGVAASLVTTLVNYSISVALGLAGTVENHVNRGGRTTADRLLGIRGAIYFGLGCAVLGLGLAICFNITQWLRDRSARSTKAHEPEFAPEEKNSNLVPQA